MMLVNSIQRSSLLMCGLLALSPVGAAVLRPYDSQIAPRGVDVSPDAIPRAASAPSHELHLRSTPQLDQSMSTMKVESEITRIQETFANFQGQLSKLFATLKADFLKKTSHGSAPLPPPSLTHHHRTFDPLATNNIAVYYGQSPLTTSTNLLDLCSNPAITIINLAFVPTFFGPNGYPTTSFGPACSAPQTPLRAAKAPGLQNCAELGTQISQCQAHGKIILVSLGGYVASSAFPTPASARAFASTLWNLFGAGTGESTELRPFGPGVVVDGFDIDNEDHSTANWAEFAHALKAKYASAEAAASGKRFYLSSTPQCPRPDASIPLDVMRMSDFVNVQFYNNPACDMGTGRNGFLESFEAWSTDLAGAGAQTRLFVAAPAWPGAGSGYVFGRRLKDLIGRAKGRGAKFGNFGGVAMWDGVEGLANVDARGKNFIEFAAEALA